jgi:tRNA(fMet)-specific endonuclease VapC
LLDTDHISFLQRRAGREFINLSARIAQHSLSDFTLSIVSFHGQVLGAHTFINRSQTKADILRGYTLLLEALAGFSIAPVLPFDTESITVFDELRAQKIRVSTMDLRIAAIALSKNLVLLTCNIGDFGKVPELTIDDWTV